MLKLGMKSRQRTGIKKTQDSEDGTAIKNHFKEI